MSNARPPRRRRWHRHAGVFSLVIAAVVSLIAIFPLLWMALSGLKSAAEVLAVPFRFWPSVLHPENYTSLLTGQVDASFFPAGASYVWALAFTFIVSAISVALSLIVNSMAGYVFARLKFPGKRILWIVFLIPWFVPAMTTYISTFQVVNDLNMLDTVGVLILPGVVYSYSIFFFRQFFLNVPTSVEEAAKIDGASFFRTYTGIFLPMSGTPLTIMGISVFLGYWSSFLWPSMTVSNPRLYQINQLISYLKSTYSQHMHLVLAASAMAAIPTIVLLLIFQRQIMQGVKISGMK